MNATQKLPLPLLPLPPSSHLLTHNLTPDSHTPDATAFHDGVLRSNPSIQRRARLLEEAAHYSHVSPLPLPFPYRIEMEEDDKDGDKNRAIERWLADREALKEVDVGPASLKAYSSDNRIKDYQLIGFAPRGLCDCLPTLDVGNAFEFIGVPALSAGSMKINQALVDNGYGGHSPVVDESPRSVKWSSETDEAQRAREVFTDILAGHTVLFGTSEDKRYAPWSLRYSGHQFGIWAGQLGDGRAMSILEVQHPDDPNLTYELQLKGAGRTPFSRTADGLAVLRSSIREYLGAEAVNALNIPTTRSLAIILYPSLPVQRESPIPEKAAIVTRLAPSFIRIGNFESLNPPTNVFAFSITGQQSAHWEALRVLGEWVCRRVLQLNLGPATADGKPPVWGKELVLECARRNARMVAGWQAYGFMHGVINTDNVSILGLTLDYGPYAFMDIFYDNHICNHTDQEGRYAFKYQPTMIIYALRALLASLSPLIGAEQELGHAVPPRWLDEASKEKLEIWREDGMELSLEVEETIMDTFNAEYWLLMRKRLGLRKEVMSDPKRIVRPFLELLETHQMDFHSTLRLLTSFRPTSSKEDLESFAVRLTPEVFIHSDACERARGDLVSWLEIYVARIIEDRDEWEEGDQWLETRKFESSSANPRFVLRQWVLEEVIGKVEKDPNTGRRVLAKVLDMASNPFKPWGAENYTGPEGALDEEIKEERRYCGIGPKKYLGFQCSCSS